MLPTIKKHIPNLSKTERWETKDAGTRWYSLQTTHVHVSGKQLHIKLKIAYENNPENEGECTCIGFLKIVMITNV